jgi:hypothetical protein
MKTNLTNWLSALCAILLIVLLALQTKQKSQLESLRQDLTAIDLRQQETREAVQQQTETTYHALGMVIPEELLKSQINKLVAFEARIGDENSWPKDLTNADAMVAELRALVRQIPPWAEEDLLPRLNAVRWGVQSFQTLHANSNAQGENLDAAANAYANQLSIQPDGGSTNIAAMLSSRQQDATARFASFRRNSAINEATNQLELAVMTDGLGVWQRLNEWTNDPNALQLRQQLKARLIEEEISKLAESAKTSLQMLDGITNDALRQAGYVRVLDSITSQRLSLMEQPDAPESASRSLDDIAQIAEFRIKAETEKKREFESQRQRDYQRWALKNIKQFNDKYDIAIKEPHGNGYTTIKDDMVKLLEPISPSYLDPAVGKLFNEAFYDRGWAKLGDSGGMAYRPVVALSEATVVKKTPSNFDK